MDKLSEVLQRFSISAGVFHSGGLCGVSAFDEDEQTAHLHLLKSGQIKLTTHGHPPQLVSTPSLIFYPRKLQHRLQANQSDKAEVVCATIQYGMASRNSLSLALPDYLVLPFNQHPEIERATAWLFDEAFGDQSARISIMDRLCEILIIQLFRHLLNSNTSKKGMLAGLSHPEISRALEAIHRSPEKHWTLDTMAETALVSRAKFANLFKQVTQQTPNEYLTDWRIGIAQGLLKKGEQIALIAYQVGYDNPSALSRIFRKRVGMSPREWQKLHS